MEGSSATIAHDTTTAPIEWKKLDPEAIIPTRGTPESAGWDLYALKTVDITEGGGSVVVPTGIAIQLPKGTYGRIAMRSGLAVREHLAVSAGVIDSDYTGAIGVVVFCTRVKGALLEHVDGRVPLMVVATTIKKGERFAQLIVEKYDDSPAVEVKEFSRAPAQTHAGWGSTGTK